MSKITLHNYEAFLLDHVEGNLSAADSVLLKAFCKEHPELQIDLKDLELPALSPEPVDLSFKNSLFKTEEQVPGEELLTYLEGMMLPEDRIAFELRLVQDKELAAELEIYKKTFLAAEQEVVASFKPSLRKTEDDLILNNRLLAYLENQLPATEKAGLEKELLSNAALQKELTLLSKTVVSADLSVVYPDKETLKKEGKVIRLFGWRSTGAVAAALVLLMGLIVVFTYFLSDRNGTNTSLAGNEGKKENKTAAPITHTITTNAPAVVKQTQTASNPASLPLENEKAAERTNRVTRTPAKETPLFASQKEEQRHDKQLGDKKKEELVAATPTVNTPVPAEPVRKETSELAVASVKQDLTEDSTLNKQNYLLVSDEFDESELGDQKDSREKGFWKRAVKVAKQANKLGVKSIEGQEDQQNSYHLSFNSFSMGKK